jgi:hypothetical protein
MSSNPRRLRLVVLGLLLLALSIPTAARAQSSGTIRGVVTDAQGAVLPGATVLLKNQATNQE